MSKWELKRIAKSVGATAVVKLGTPTPEELGYADEVAVILLGAGATAKDLGSVERILEKMPQGIKDPRVQHALSDENWPKQNESVGVGTTDWFRMMMDRLQ